MRNVVLFILLCSILHAGTTIELKKGWQLIGVPTVLDISSSLNSENVEIVWGFDAATQSWSGYSPVDETHAEILEQYTELETLQPWQAMWIYSNTDWSLDVGESEPPQSPKNSSITLEKGWNLVAIPQESVVPDDFFGDAVVWKYSSDQAWSVNDGTLDFPSIDAISGGEGLWVKSETARSIDMGNALSKLHTFKSETSMLAYIRKMSNYYGRRIFDVGGGEVPVTDDSINAFSEPESADDATTTNLQEAGVDEGDILKHDGTYIFNADNSNKKIIVTSFARIVQQDYEPIYEIDMNSTDVVVMYLQNNRLSVISRQAYAYLHDITGEPGDATAGGAKRLSIMPEYAQERFLLDVFDVSDINNITLMRSHKIDGYYQDSRLIDGRLFLVSQFSPYIRYEYPIDYKDPVILSEQLLPSITSDGNTSSLVTPSKLYAPYKLDQRSSITSISSFNIDDGKRNETVSFLGSTHTRYASQTSLYLVSNEYPIYFDRTRYKEQQMIYKFSLGSAMAYEGRGFVEGRVLNQFSMSEYNGHLRVATTSGWTWWGEGDTINSVYILKQSGELLGVEGTLSGLGHEGETIRAVRFMGDHGYVVTFRQTDPLYTLDLSDPENPEKVGELSIPGFSEYLHPVDANRVLSIGRDADETGRRGALQLQLFDITDFANPQLADKIRIGDRYTYSEAEHNHKAFAYRDSDSMFGVPYRSGSENFGIYQVEGMTINALHTVSSDASGWGYVGRGLIFDINGSSYGALLKGSNIICETVK